MLNEPELLGYRLHTVLGGLDQSLLIFAKETEDRPGSDADVTVTRDSAVPG
jgi:hypothetical protein